MNLLNYNCIFTVTVYCYILSVTIKIWCLCLCKNCSCSLNLLDLFWTLYYFLNHASSNVHKYQLQFC